jgi:hypothetical protein
MPSRLRRCVNDAAAALRLAAPGSSTESDMHSIKKTLVTAVLCIAGGTFGHSIHAIAADPAADTAKAQYDAERSRCMSGTTGQDQASCLRSAGAAYDSAKQGKLRDPNTQFHDNALARCASLPASDRADCESRVDGGGAVSGSVKGGGLIKETVTPVPATNR